MKTRVSFKLEIMPNKLNKRGTAPIYYCITVRGKVAMLTTGVRVAPAEWDKVTKRVRGTTPAARLANASLVKMTDRLTDLHADLERQGKAVTATGIQQLYRRNGAIMSLAELCDMFLEARTALVGIQISVSTVNGERHSVTALLAFLKGRRLGEMRPEEFTAGMVEQFSHWLLTSKGMAYSALNSYISKIMQALKWGVLHGHLDAMPCAGYKAKRQETAEIMYLTVDEVAALTVAPQPSKRFERVRDCFVFQCWTGLAYADLAGLDVAKNVETGPNGRRLLRVRRAKSTLFKGFECVIPLLPEAERLLAKYGDKLPLPEITGYNKLLKQIGKPLGLGPEKMKSHVGRKTAGTLLLNKGIPVPVVSKFLGHSNVGITQKLYAKLLDTTVVDAFDSVFGGPVPPPSTAGLLADLDSSAGRVVPMYRAANRVAV